MSTIDALQQAPDRPSARIRTMRSRTGWLTTPVIIGLVVAVGWIVVALTVQWWSPYNPIAPSGPSLVGPAPRTCSAPTSWDATC